MMAIRTVALSVIGVSLMVVGLFEGQQCKSVRIAHVKSIFSIAPSPVGAKVLFYGSAEQAEGEIVTGRVFRLQLDGPDSPVLQLKAPEASNPSAPVWQRDGSRAYFETDEGVYELKPADGDPELLWKGPSTGLAISRDGLFLAFWRVGKGADTLFLYDLKKRSETRTWRVPDRYEGDKAGWDVVFSHDGQALYARTYDEPSSTPLKRFDIRSGKATVTSSAVYAVAEGQDAVYFIAVSGSRRSLRKISTTGQTSLAAKDFAYDSLSSGGSSRWLISQDYRTKQIVVLDTETDTIKSVGKYDSATVLPNGNLLVVSGPEIRVGDPLCELPSPTVRR